MAGVSQKKVVILQRDSTLGDVLQSIVEDRCNPPPRIQIIQNTDRTIDAADVAIIDADFLQKGSSLDKVSQLVGGGAFPIFISGNEFLAEHLNNKGVPCLPLPADSEIIEALVHKSLHRPDQSHREVMAQKLADLDCGQLNAAARPVQRNFTTAAANISDAKELPIVSPSSEASPRRSTSIPSDRKIILVVDDEEAVRDVTGEVLAEAGEMPFPIHILSAANLAEARKILSGDQPPHVALIDVRLGGELGTDLIQNCRDSGSAPIFMSGDPGDAKSIVDLGHPYIAKPFRAAEAGTLITNLLRSADSLLKPSVGTAPLHPHDRIAAGGAHTAAPLALVPALA